MTGLFHLALISSSFIHVVACVRISFLFKLNYISLYTTFCLSIHLLMSTWVASTSWLMWIMLLWTWGVQIFCVPAFSSFGCIYKRMIGSYGNSMLYTFFEWATNFSTAAAPFYIFTSTAQGSNFFIFLPTFFKQDFKMLIIAILMGVMLYLLVLISISLKTDDVKDHFMCLLAICLFSLEKSLFKSFPHFLIELSWHFCGKSVTNVKY